ncbi:MAG: nicotinamide-nucleotide adenylyltransferase [Methanobrevibacter sp.]|jgi:nicotinamide-nucleotide adenylyltransferase|nr:nicotinamide-nucleotide adenylyltransferase [Methanobrevibacter sp.]
MKRDYENLIGKRNCGLLIGRMQPFHNGHFQVIKKAFEEVDELIIGIGSAQLSHTVKNPFTAGERILMIKKSLIEEGFDINKIYLIPLTDIMNHNLWVAHVETLTPPFNKVFSGNSLVQQLFSESGYKLNTHRLFNREILSGTRVRQMMITNENWEMLVPKATVDIIKKIKGVERIKHISLTESI